MAVKTIVITEVLLENIRSLILCKLTYSETFQRPKISVSIFNLFIDCIRLEILWLLVGSLRKSIHLVLDNSSDPTGTTRSLLNAGLSMPILHWLQMVLMPYKHGFDILLVIDATLSKR